jgi:ferredoxin
MPLTIEQKKTTQIGRVFLNTDLCVVKTKEKSCGSCSEHCPTQAVYMVPYKNFLTIPETNPDICVGCGHVNMFVLWNSHIQPFMSYLTK